MLFHAGLHDALSGGFFGVDVFFVISGFLIGRILFTEVAEGRFSILRFYERRARRILPALLTVLLLSYGFARMLLSPLEFADFRDSLLATLGFASNIYFWLHSGYFETANELKPLLHTWSLGLEEQYYILFPLLAYVFKSRVWLMRVLLLLAVASFAWAVSSVAKAPDAAFYLLPARAWELLLGAMGAVWASQHSLRDAWRKALSLLGLAMIATAVIGFNARMPHPGFYTLVPCVGTLLILVAHAPGGLASKILELPPFVFIGKISYSAYLWHQPLFAFWIYRYGKQSFATFSPLLIAVTVALAYISWRFVEEPARKPATTPNKRLALYCGYALVLLATVMVPQKWFTQQHPNEALQALNRIDNLYEHFDFQKNIRNGVCHSVPMPARQANGCLEQRQKNIVLFGDSYAASLYQGLQAARDTLRPDYGIIQLTDGNAPPFFAPGSIDSGAALPEVNADKLKVIEAIKPEKIVIAWMIFGKNSTNDPQQELNQLNATIDRLGQISPRSNIIVVGPFPNWSVSLQKNLITYISAHNSFPRHMQQGLSTREREWDQFFKQHLQEDKVRYLSSLDALCDASGCLTSVDGTVQGLTAVDWGHLTQAGSLHLVQRLAPAIFE